MMNTIKVFIIGISCFANIVFSPINAFAQENRDIEIAEESVGRIEVYGYRKFSGEEVILGHGTGFLINNNTVVSNEHVVRSYLENLDIFKIRFIPSNSDDNISASVVAVNESDDLAIIRVKPSTDNTGITIYGSPVKKGEKVYQLGYPGLVDSARRVFDGNNKSRLTQTSGEITNFIGSKQYPSVYLHSADTAKGTSGGPLLNKCGEVVSVNSNYFRGERGEAAYRGGATSLALVKFLDENNINYSTSNQECIDRAEKIKLAKEDERRLQKANDEKLAQAAREEREKAAIIRQERLEKSNMAYNAAWNNAALTLLVLILFLIGLVIIAILLRNKVKVPYIILTYCVIMALISIIIWQAINMPSLAAYTEKIADSEKLSKTNDNIIADEELLCSPDLAKSIYRSQELREIPFIWRNNHCIGRGSQYVKSGQNIEILLMSKSDPVLTHYIYTPYKRKLVSERYFLNSNETDILRAAAPADRKCSTDDKKLISIKRQYDKMKELLPNTPSERIVYTCG